MMEENSLQSSESDSDRNAGCGVNRDSQRPSAQAAGQNAGQMDSPRTFAFIGNTEVGARLGAHLLQAGYSGLSDFSQADVVFTYTTTLSLLEDIYYGTPGLMQDSKSGAVLVNLSPTTPSFARELSAMAAVSNRFFVDAPLVVRDCALEDALADPANLIVVVGASDTAFGRVQPLLEAMAATCRHVGKAGAGQSAKIALTLQTSASIMGAVEAFSSHLFTEDAYDAEELADLSVHAGFIAPAQRGLVEALLERRLRGTYTMEMMIAELNAALMFAEEKQTAFSQADAAFHLLQLLGVVGAASLAPAGASLAFSTQEEAKRFGVDWTRAEGFFHEHANDDAEDEDDS